MLAIPPISWADFIAAADTFDVLLFEGSSTISEEIEAGTFGPYSHSAMVVRKSPSDPPLLWQTGPDKIVVDVLTNSEHPGAQLNPMALALQFLNDGQDTPFYRRYSGPVTQEMRDRVWAFATKMDGTPFGTIDELIANWVAARVTHGEGVVHKDQIFCAALVAMTFQDAGLLAPTPIPYWYCPSSWGNENYEVDLLQGSFLVEQAIDMATVPTSA